MDHLHTQSIFYDVMIQFRISVPFFQNKLTPTLTLPHQRTVIKPQGHKFTDIRP